MRSLTYLEPLRPLSQLWKLNLRDCGKLTSLEPLGSLSRLLDLSFSLCNSLPPSALSPLSLCTALKQLDITDCPAFDLCPLASCRDLRRLYANLFKLDLTPLRGLMPRLEVQRSRDELLDARTL